MNHRPPSSGAPTETTDLAIVRRFPALARVPRARLGRFPTPVESLDRVSPGLWIKRDDLAGTIVGGNKVRALEYLLGAVRPGERVATVGSAGSTHVASVAAYAAVVGATFSAARWTQEMNPSAERVATRVSPSTSRVFSTPIAAFAWSWLERIRGTHWIPAGGSSPLGVLGHVNAGLELVEQIDAGALPPPSAVVVPLGTGGTAAGLLLAFAVSERPVQVVGVRVVPRIVARERRVRRLANATARYIERLSGAALPRVHRSALRVEHDEYGGAYGRETRTGRDAARRLHDAYGIELDATYSAKAFAFAMANAAREPTLFWLTFDARALEPT